jgi:hypothetical protein
MAAPRSLIRSLSPQSATIRSLKQATPGAPKTTNVGQYPLSDTRQNPATKKVVDPGQGLETIEGNFSRVKLLEETQNPTVRRDPKISPPRTQRVRASRT